MQTSFMKSIVYAGLFSAGLSGAALAMPLAAMPGASSSPAIQVDYACGRGWHLNDWNECVRNRWHRPPPRWVDRGWGPRYGAWDEGRGHWRHHHHRPPQSWGWNGDD